jgi:hypothetical protein
MPLSPPVTTAFLPVSFPVPAIALLAAVGNWIHLGLDTGHWLLLIGKAHGHSFLVLGPELGLTVDNRSRTPETCTSPGAATGDFGGKGLNDQSAGRPHRSGGDICGGSLPHNVGCHGGGVYLRLLSVNAGWGPDKPSSMTAGGARVAFIGPARYAARSRSAIPQLSRAYRHVPRLGSAGPCVDSGVRMPGAPNGFGAAR